MVSIYVDVDISHGIESKGFLRRSLQSSTLNVPSECYSQKDGGICRDPKTESLNVDQTRQSGESTSRVPWSLRFLGSLGGRGGVDLTLRLFLVSGG